MNDRLTDKAKRWIPSPDYGCSDNTSAIMGIWISDGYDVDWIWSNNQVIGYNLVPKRTVVANTIVKYRIEFV